jgi:hypothetical protein
MKKKGEIIEIPELSNLLSGLYSKSRIWTDGRVYQIKELVGQVNDLKFYIYPNDHNPPHFHVRSKNCEIDLSFSLDDGKCIGGNAKDKNAIKKIQYFHQQYKPVLQKKWNEFQELAHLN